MEDRDIYHRAKISYNFLSDFNDVIDRQFEIYKQHIIKQILEELLVKIKEIKEKEEIKEIKK